ncbi:MAG: DUF1015 domain-containing protein [Anaerolineae bacterium]|nr:DUF1015 domain-containing protein [Anaerolineae bacterium]
MTIIDTIGIQIPQILLPKQGIDLQKWAVIACDQFTSQPEYWQQVEKFIGDSPSTYNLILPEVFLGKPEEEKRIALTQQTMQKYLDENIFYVHQGAILVERTTDKATRHGVMLALDLERYDYNKGSQSLIRATEGTILERLPPRIRIRKGAKLELPHILVLIDDPENKVFEPLISNKPNLNLLYDFELMFGSGHLKGFSLDHSALLNGMIQTLEHLAEPAAFQNKYGVSGEKSVLLFAVGDGNHSLATAKAIWEQIKSEVGMNHPARYALVEIENVHDSGLQFEPIHRILFDVKEDYKTAMQQFFGAGFSFDRCSNEQEMINYVTRQAPDRHIVGVVSPTEIGIASIQPTTSNLPVGTLQAFLDGWLKHGKASQIDYVHGESVVMELGRKPNNLGFLLPAMNKSDLFKTVILDGVLPRKTFSMGEAKEKRFYMECRRIDS